MNKPAHEDPFDSTFEADDEFATDNAWSKPDALSAAIEAFAAEAAPDPFAPDSLVADPVLAPAESFEAAPDPFAAAPVLETPDEFPAFDKPAPAADAFVAEAEPEAPFAMTGEAGFSSSGGEAIVPRITIQIFCERDQTTTIAEQACGDRRMSRAAVVVRQGGLSAALQEYQSQPTPSLIVVESLAPPAEMLDQLDRLAEVCDPGTKVVVIGRANDIALYRELMRRGVSEYMVPPFAPLDLIQSISNLYTDPSAPFLGRSVAFVGAKGGVGASTVAHNFAHTLTEHMQTNAVIVDMDLPFGTAGLDFNQDPLQGVVDALSQPDRLDSTLLERMMARCTDKLSLFAAPATLDDDYEISADAFEEVASKIRTTAPYVILDLPHLWSGWMRRMLLTGDDVIIVATPDLASLRNAKNMVDLVRSARPNDEPPRLVLNQVGVPGRPEIPVKDFGDALGIAPALVLGWDPKLFGMAANNGQMIGQMNTKSKAIEGFHHLAQLIARREAAPPPKKSVLSSLFKGK